jgi:hypothetical protein
MRLGSKVASTALAAVCIAIAAPLGASGASAEERTCRGTLRAITVVNLRVPQGATCTLAGTRIKGKVRVLRRATLLATNIHVVGDIQAENHERVSVKSSRIGGSIQIVQGGSATVTANNVKGDIQFFENRRAIVVKNNRVDGNLQCKENRKAPTGGANRVGGTKEDQCRRL